MSEMFERVCLAIVDALINSDFETSHMKEHQIIAAARAALEAMREPTDDMVSAVGIHWGTALESDWQTMIEAALKPVDA